MGFNSAFKGLIGVMKGTRKGQPEWPAHDLPITVDSNFQRMN